MSRRGLGGKGKETWPRRRIVIGVLRSECRSRLRRYCNVLRRGANSRIVVTVVVAVIVVVGSASDRVCGLRSEVASTCARCERAAR